MDVIKLKGTVTLDWGGPNTITGFLIKIKEGRSQKLERGGKALPQEPSEGARPCQHLGLELVAGNVKG